MKAFVLREPGVVGWHDAPEPELKQEMSQTLDLALHGLRLHAFLEFQTPEQAAVLAM